MKIKFIVIGKTNTSFIKEAIAEYEKRLKHYASFEIICLPDIKNAGKLNEVQLKTKEGESILANINAGDELILLDEKGAQYTSVEFAALLTKKMNAATKSLAFVAGGAFGFSDEVYKKATALLSLSKMTFTHQMVRLIFVEQVYRAFTIIKGEGYHHE